MNGVMLCQRLLYPEIARIDSRLNISYFISTVFYLLAESFIFSRLVFGHGTIIALNEYVLC